MGEAGADVVGVDYRVPLTEAARRASAVTTPCRATSTRPLLFAPWDAARAPQVRAIARARAGPPPGHVFNLGHGVLPDTDPDVLTRVVELVHEASAR